MFMHTEFLLHFNSILFVHQPKPDASEDEENSKEEDSDREKSDDDSSSGEDETDAPMLLEQDIIDVSQIPL